MIGWKVEVSEDENEVCIIPLYKIPAPIFRDLIYHLEEAGFTHWIPADERCGYRIVKMPKEKEKDENEIFVD